jgi:Flp pilus assembly protein TadB
LNEAVVLRWIVPLLIVASAAALYLVWRAVMLRQRARQRLESGLAADETLGRPVRRKARPLTRRYRWLPWLVAVALFATLFAMGWLLPYCFAFALLVGMLGSQIESFMAAQRAAKIENQLADGIDLMVGALGAGAGLSQALEAALHESAAPLRGQLAEVQSRIRLGDDPRQVFQALAERVPLETFLLFSSTLATHWEVGGSLTSTLSSVGRTIRDRIEISRRIRANVSQSQVSTIAVLALTYFIALITWRTNPENMREFVATSTGGWFVAATILLQGLGIFWMSAISKPKF